MTTIRNRYEREKGQPLNADLFVQLFYAVNSLATVKWLNNFPMGKSQELDRSCRKKRKEKKN